MEIKNIPIGQIKPFEKNAKKHDKKQIDLVARSIKRFGWGQPLVVDKTNTLIIGHCRLSAALQLGLKEVPVLMMENLTPEEVSAYRLTDNKSNESAWSMDLVIPELKGLTPELLDLTGFDSDLLIEADEKDDVVPEDAPPVCKLGDLWSLGSHRLLCGDSTVKEQVERLMGGKRADMVFTSPPYNANTKTGDGDIFTSKKSKKLYADGYSDNLTADEYVSFAQSVLELCFNFTDGFIFWNVSYNKNSRYQYIQQITPWLEYLREQICWKKSSTIPFKGSMMRDWEPIYLFSTIKANLGLDKVTSNFWEVSNTNSQQENHKACYPVELVIKGIELINGSVNVLDPFLGSGSTLIACEKTNRVCYGMELDPHYCDVIIKRFIDFTGKEAVRLSDGKKYSEIRI